jgi:hypothetical protein
VYDGGMWVVAIVFAVISYTLAAAAAARAFGIGVAELAVGVGPGVSILLERQESAGEDGASGGERRGLRPRFVLGGWVRFVDPDAVTPAQRVGMALAGVTPMLLVATVYLGSATLPELGRAVVDLLAARSPFGLAQVALEDAYACLEAEPMRFSALLLVKTATWNLLPLPHTGVGQGWVALVPSLLARERLVMAGVLVTTIWCVLWLVAVVAWLAAVA